MTSVFFRLVYEPQEERKCAWTDTFSHIVYVYYNHSKEKLQSHILIWTVDCILLLSSCAKKKWWHTAATVKHSYPCYWKKKASPLCKKPSLTDSWKGYISRWRNRNRTANENSQMTSWSLIAICAFLNVALPHWALSWTLGVPHSVKAEMMLVSTGLELWPTKE